MRSFEVTFPDDLCDKVREIIKSHDDLHWNLIKSDNDMWLAKAFIHENTKDQDLVDDLLDKLDGHEGWAMGIMPTEAFIDHDTDRGHKESDTKTEVEKDDGGSTVLREEIFVDVEKGTRITRIFLALVVLSALVTTLGVNADNTAVVIGGMVIAPLLGPLLGLSLGATLGSVKLLLKGLKATVLGGGLAILTAIAISFFIDINLESEELLSRSRLGLDAIILALASGVAGALSVSSRLSSTFVGVMVAVALLPPAIGVSLFLVAGDYNDAFRAFVLLLTNIVCVVFACQATFAVQGIRPRTYYQKKEAEKSSRASFIFWGSLILGLGVLIFLLSKGQ